MSSEFMNGTPATLEAIYDLSAGGQIRGALYNTIVLSSPEADIVDDITCPTIGRYATLYWPGGNPDHGNNLETITLNSDTPPPMETMAEVSRIRKAILSASVGQTALNRVPKDMQRMWRDAAAVQAPVPLVDSLDLICRAMRLPLAVCFTSDVTKGPPNTRMMHLFYPNTINPEPVLGELQKSVQAAIDRESL